MTLPIELSLPADGGKGARIAVGGIDLAKACRGVQVTSEAGHLTRIVLDLVVYDVAQLDGQAFVIIPDATREALIALGWTPPEGDRG